MLLPRKLLGKQTTFFTILREPAEALESFYDYNRKLRHRFGWNSFAEFVDE